MSGIRCTADCHSMVLWYHGTADAEELRILILKALAEMAKTNTTGAPGMPSQASQINVPNLQSAYQQHFTSENPATSASQYIQPVNVPGAAVGATPFAGVMSSTSSYGLNEAIPSEQNAPANILRPGACDLSLVARADAGECPFSCRYKTLFRLWFSKTGVLI